MAPETPLNASDTLSTFLHGQNLVEALACVERELRRKPTRAGHLLRLDLFCVLEDWERAARQAETCTRFDSACLPLMTLVHALTTCEREREAVFSGTAIPSLPDTPPAWLTEQLTALHLQTGGTLAEADAAREAALSAAPATPGTAVTASATESDGAEPVAFDWITDSDTRLGPVLEVFSADKYLWVPFERLTGLTVAPPSSLRDFVWLPVIYELDGQRRHGFVPGRYPNSARAGDALALGRETCWETVGETGVLGLGQRVLSTSAGDLSLFDVRELRLQAGGAA